MADTKTAAREAVRADRKATHHAARHRHNPLVEALGTASELADQPQLVALAAGTIAVGAASGRGSVVRTGVRMLASHLVATGIKTAIKRSVDRTRPATALATGHHRFEPGHSHDHDQTAFPSGHTAGAVAIAQAIARDHPGAALPVRLTAGAVGAIQPLRGTHYVGDVLVGAVIGWVGERLASAALDAAERALARRRAPHAEPARIERTTGGSMEA